MVKEDYIMRLISEMVRAVLKLLFNIDTDSPSMELLEDTEEKETLVKLLDLAKSGKINYAENLLYSLPDSSDRERLKMKILFYSYVNKFDDDFLENNNYSRDEVKDGLKDVLKNEGLSSISDIYM